MPPSKSIASHTTWLEVLDKALMAPKGVRIWYPLRKSAVNARFQFYRARRADRLLNHEIYKDDQSNPLFKRSAYDVLIFNIGELDVGRGWPLEIVKADAAELQLEEI